MMQVRTAGDLRNVDASGLRSGQKKAADSLDSGFAALLEKKDIRLTENRDSRNEPEVSGRDEMEDKAEGGQEKDTAEPGLSADAIPWLLQEGLTVRLQTLHFTEECPVEAALLCKAEAESPPSNYPEALFGTAGEPEAVSQPDAPGGLPGEADAIWGLSSGNIQDKKQPSTVPGGEEAGNQDETVLLNPKEGDISPPSGEAAGNKNLQTAERGGRAELEHQTAQSLKGLSGQERKREADEADGYFKAGIQEEQMLRTELERPLQAAMPRPLSEEAVRMPTSVQTLVQDTAETLASHMPLKEGVLELELEPVSLGRMTIRVAFESGRATVTVLSSSAETVEILSKNASQLARILEERTGEPAIVYTPQTSEPGDESAAERHGGQGERQTGQERKREQGEAFAQQLRLGLVPEASVTGR